MSAETYLDKACPGAGSRAELWARFLSLAGARTVAEIGVWRGQFAEAVLRSCPGIERYYMVDSWHHLDDWNKPANVSDADFEDVYAEALRRTEFASAQRTVLRGRTVDALERIPDQSLDFAYIDADHSLRGITVDLHRVLPKMRPGGWIAGDDFCPTVWQHSVRYEPTLVFPYAVYFAEAIEAMIYAPGFSQFLIALPEPGCPHRRGFTFIDLTSSYGSVAVGTALNRPPRWRSALEYGKRAVSTRLVTWGNRR